MGGGEWGVGGGGGGGGVILMYIYIANLFYFPTPFTEFKNLALFSPNFGHTFGAKVIFLDNISPKWCQNQEITGF